MKRLATLLGLFVVLVTPSIAQTSTVTGRVVDPTGAVIPNADVNVARSGTLVGHATTDASGSFSIVAPEGEYQVSVSAPGFRKVSGRTVHLPNATLALEVGSGGGVEVQPEPVPVATDPASELRQQVDPPHPTSVLDHTPWEYGVLTQDGVGLTQDRSGFRFASLGIHAGKVLTDPIGHGALRGNFEYAAELYPFWQSYTPTLIRANCVAQPASPTGVSCSPNFQTGGTYSGVTLTPIILRWNLNGTRRVSFWGQAAGGVLWTNHKYPAFGGVPYTLTNDGPNADASVWNFTPQGGVGMHFFLHPRRSLDLGINAVHISSASLGDRNPGVNASLQFTLGYTLWK